MSRAHTEYVTIAGKVYPVDTDTQQKIASRALSSANINSVSVWRLGVKTHLVLLADTNVDPVENGTAPAHDTPSLLSELNNEGLTWAEWAGAAGCAPFGEGILRDEWRAGVDPTEYRANPERRDLLARVIARKATRADAEDWLFNDVYPSKGYKVVQINGLFCVVKPK